MHIPDNKHGICNSCHGKLTYLRPPFCRGCGGTVDGVLDICRECVNSLRPWRKAYSVFEFDGLVRTMIHKFKYHGNVALCRFFMHVVYSQLMKAKDKQNYQLIVPVPLHWFKKLTRGYNQTELLACELSKITGIPYFNMLNRNKWTKPQARLDRLRRRKNLKNAFIIKKNGIKSQKKFILLIDDVFTTGSTLEECTKTLLSSGVEFIDIITLAKG